MKKIIFYSAILLISFFIACENSGTTEVKTEKSGTTVNEPVQNNITDTSKRTSISVGSGGADVKHKNTQINVDKNGIKVGTKDVNVEIKK